MSKKESDAGKILQDTEVYWTTGIIFEQRCRFVNFGVKVNFYKRNRFVLHLYHTNITWHIFESAEVASLRKLVHHSGVGYMFALPQQQQS